MKKLLLPLLTLFCLDVISAPHLFFTDLVSGPATGNSDNSHPGQIAGQDGAIVTVWGKNLGANQLGSQVLVNGVSARIYSWGNAVGPADLFSKMGMQMLVFQIPAAAAAGSTGIAVMVNGELSNILPFTIRNGNIYFIKNNGNDITGNGSWANPWASLDNIFNTGALNKIAAGDIIYVGDNVVHNALAGDRSCIDLGEPGTEQLPKAVVAYPGANAFIGNTSIASAYSLWVSGFGPTVNWVISKFHLTAKDGAANMYHNFRLVGNRITAPLGSEPTGAIAAQGNHLYILGNELTSVGFAGTSKLYHPIYMQSAESCSGPRLPTETDREIAWNYLHDNFSYDGINIYRECGSSAYMTHHRVHDNYIENQTGCGIRIGDYVTGENWIYNNIIVNAGIGPNPGGDQAMHVPALIHAGWDDTSTLIHFYNNIIYGGGFTGGAAWSSSMTGFFNTHPYTLDFRNNIIVSTVPGIAYYNQQFPAPAAGVENNIWYGAGNAPSWDVNAIPSDPLFENASAGNFHLTAASPAKDMARPITPSAAQPIPPFDFDAVSRPQNNAADLGSYEYMPQIILPLHLLNLQVKQTTPHLVTVYWQARNQQDTKDYDVEMSRDNITFSKVANLVMHSSDNYSSSADVTANRRYYYRVLQRYFNGTVNYSNVVSILIKNEVLDLWLLPNPAGQFAKITGNFPVGTNGSISIYDCRGTEVQSEHFTVSSAGEIKISLYKLAAGVYYLQLRTEKITTVLKLVKA